MIWHEFLADYAYFYKILAILKGISKVELVMKGRAHVNFSQSQAKWSLLGWPLSITYFALNCLYLSQSITGREGIRAHA